MPGADRDTPCVTRPNCRRRPSSCPSNNGTLFIRSSRRGTKPPQLAWIEMSCQGPQAAGNSSTTLERFSSPAPHSPNRPALPCTTWRPTARRQSRTLFQRAQSLSLSACAKITGLATTSIRGRLRHSTCSQTRASKKPLRHYCLLCFPVVSALPRDHECDAWWPEHMLSGTARDVSPFASVACKLRRQWPPNQPLPELDVRIRFLHQRRACGCTLPTATGVRLRCQHVAKRLMQC